MAASPSSTVFSSPADDYLRVSNCYHTSQRCGRVWEVGSNTCTTQPHGDGEGIKMESERGGGGARAHSLFAYQQTDEKAFQIEYRSSRSSKVGQTTEGEGGHVIWMKIRKLLENARFLLLDAVRQYRYSRIRPLDAKDTVSWGPWMAVVANRAMFTSSDAIATSSTLQRVRESGWKTRTAILHYGTIVHCLKCWTPRVAYCRPLDSESYYYCTIIYLVNNTSKTLGECRSYSSRQP